MINERRENLDEYFYTFSVPLESSNSVKRVESIFNNDEDLIGRACSCEKLSFPLVLL